MIKIFFGIICLVGSIFAYFQWFSNVTNSDTQDYSMVWSDEFNVDGIPDSLKWSFDIGNGCDLPCGCGWGNAESQYYSDRKKENAKVVDGYLIVTAKKEPNNKTEYSSARLVTKGKGDWKYGKIDIRAKIPSGTGIWPAIWMLPSKNHYGGWPKSGEIDIMEFVGYVPDTIYGTVHTENFNGMIQTQVGGNIANNSLADEFHNYIIVWDENQIEWYVDNIQYFTFKNDSTGYKSWPFDQEFHLLLNVAVGGHWGGAKGIDDQIFPQEMKIDYVRVYQKLNLNK